MTLTDEQQARANELDSLTDLSLTIRVSGARVEVLMAVLRLLEAQDHEFRNLEEGEQAVDGSDEWVMAVKDAADAITILEEQLYDEVYG